jgi:hypothetical protein
MSDKKHDNPVTLVALTFLYSFNVCNGSREEVEKYANELTKMAERMRLFGVKDGLNAKEIASL